jgi:hypothetical protein
MRPERVRTVALQYSVFRWINEVRRINEEQAKDAPEDPVDKKPMRQFDQFSNRPECLAENYCRNSVDFARIGWHTYVVRRLYSEDFTLNSPRAEL